MSTIVPMYVKNGDLPNTMGRNTRLELCQIVNQHVPGQTVGGQLVKGVWSIWLKDLRARKHMTDTVKVINVDGRKIDVHDIYPISRSIRNEKIVFKDIPLSVNDKEILEFLNDQPGIVVKSGVIASRIRDNENKLTPFYTGDRFVCVKGLFSPALHNIGLIDHNKCRIWHKSQEVACMRCRQTDHKTTNTSQCNAYIEKQDIVTIHSPKHVLCNYYMYPLKVFNNNFLSAEHAYQWRSMTYIGMEEHAFEILNAPTPAEAKEIASRVPRYLHGDWHQIKLSVMKQILHAKADYCPLFRSTLIESTGKILVESTQDLFWASGLPPVFSDTTKPEYYPGRNHLGQVLNSVRKDLVREATISALIDVDSNNDVIFPSSTQTITTDDIHTYIHPSTLEIDLSMSRDSSHQRYITLGL